MLWKRVEDALKIMQLAEKWNEDWEETEQQPTDTAPRSGLQNDTLAVSQTMK